MSTIARLTVDEYDQMLRAGVFDQRRIEFIEGEIREMTPIGPDHETAVDQLVRWSYRSLGDDVLIRVQQSLGLPNTESAPQPDVTWAHNADYRTARPTAGDTLLVVEVAGTSRKYDLGEKADLYAAVGIRDYWVVDCQNHCVVVHREPSAKGYGSVTSFAESEPVSPLSHPEVSILPETLFQPTDA